MKVLRSTYWKPDLSTMTVVITEKDVVVPLEEIGHPPDGFAFVKDDIWEVEDGTPFSVLAYEGALRAQDNVPSERNQAILYFWMFGHFGRLNEHGLIAASSAPLTADEVREVFKQLMDLPQYNGFSLYTTASDGTEVSMRNGVNTP